MLLIEMRINRLQLINKLSSMNYEEVNELQIHMIFKTMGYVDKTARKQKEEEKDDDDCAIN